MCTMAEQEMNARRIDLMRLFIHNFKKGPDTYTKEELIILCSNAVYLSIPGTHSERVAEMEKYKLDQDFKF